MNRDRLLLGVLAASSAALAFVSALSIAYALAQADSTSELRQTCALCRDSLLQCTAKREQLEGLFGVAAAARRERAIGGGP